jgi:putative ABC transport system substrate-binding protein
MKRRDFVTLLGGAAAWPIAVSAQQPERTRRVGVLMSFAVDASEGQQRIASFREEFERLGWVHGHNVQIDYRWAAGDPDLTRKYASELVSLSPDVLLSQSTPSLRALSTATQVIPIVFVGVTDPVESGLVASLARPTGNATGFSNYEYSIGGKWVQLLKDIAPRVERVLVSVDQDNTASRRFFPTMEPIASTLRARLSQLNVRNSSSPSEIESAIAEFAKVPGGGLIVVPGNFLATDVTIALASKYGLPAVYPFRYLAVDGGLASYGIDQSELYRRAASYVDRILKGAKPADLPVQQPTKFEFVLNLKTAKALGLTISRDILLVADEVIE